MDIKAGDVVVLQMDDELMKVDSVDGDTFLVHAPIKSVSSGEFIDFWHEYDIGDVMTVYREVN